MREAQTSAERQAAYRKRQRRKTGEDAERRFSTWLPRTAMVALARIAQHHGISQRAMVERLITAADERIVRRLEPDTPEWDRYFRVTR